MRQCQLDLVKSLGANTNAEVWKKRTTTPSKDFSITFLPSNPGPGVMDLVGTIDFKELEDDVQASETIVNQLKVQMEKELLEQKLKRKHEAVTKGSRHDPSRTRKDEGAKSAKETVEQVEQKGKPGLQSVAGLNQKSNNEQPTKGSSETEDDKQIEASRPSWASEGSYCFARLNENEVWGEVQILRHQPPNLCMVLFVHTGDHAVVAPANMVKNLPAGHINDSNVGKDGTGKKQIAGDQTKKGGDSVELWKPESVCLAKWVQDGVWYRAKVLEALEGNCYTVIFEDYGNIAVTYPTGMVTCRSQVPETDVIDVFVPKDREEGNACLALYKEELIWCRVNLVKKTKKGWEVEFTDYGGEMAEVEEVNLVDSVEEVPQGHAIDPSALTCVEEDVVVEKVEMQEGELVKTGNHEVGKESSEDEGQGGYMTMASQCSIPKHNVAVNGEDAEEPSMETEAAPPKPVASSSAPAAESPSASAESSSSPRAPSPPNPALLPALLLQPDDMCLAVWAEDGVCSFISLLYNAWIFQLS